MYSIIVKVFQIFHRMNLDTAQQLISKVVVINVDDAVLRIPGLWLQHSFSTTNHFANLVGTFYKQKLISAAFSILRSSDALDFVGNPINFVGSLGSGVASFFYEPAKGIMSGPGGFGQGLQKGSKELVSGSLEAVFGTLSKVSGSLLTKPLEWACLDSDYQKKRENQKKANTIGEGLGSGVRNLGTGLFEGVTGVVTQPIKGGRKEGGLGVVKGVGKGIAGVVTKPALGVVDVVTKTTEGIANQTKSAKKTLPRVRPPRYIPETGILTTYNPQLSEAKARFWNLESGKYRELNFITHTDLNPNETAILTNTIFFVVKKFKFENAKVTFNTPLRDFQELTSQNLIIVIKYCAQGLGAQGREHQLTCDDPKTVTAVMSMLSEVSNRMTRNAVKRTVLKEKSGTLHFQIVKTHSSTNATWKPCQFTIADGIMTWTAEHQNQTLNLVGARCTSLGKGLWAIQSGEERVRFKCTDDKTVLDWIDACVANGSVRHFLRDTL